MVGAMTTAVRSMNLEANDVDKLIAYFERTATLPSKFGP